MTKKLFIPANPDATNSELDAKKIVKNVELNDSQRDALIQQYVELCIDGMDHKDMYHFIYNTLAEDFDKLSDLELQDEIRYSFDEETLDELIENVTNETVLDTNNTGGKY